MIITAKRTIILFFTVVVMFVCVLVRLAYISVSMISDVSSVRSSRVIQAGQTRGMIYDRNMNPVVNRTFHTMLVVNPTQEAMKCLEMYLDKEAFADAGILASQGKPFLIECDSYNGDCDDIIDIIIYNRYSENDNAVHLVGYTDSTGNGVTGIEKSFNDLLNEYSGTVSVRYNADSSGVMLGGMGFEIINDNYDSKGGVVLTVDNEIQRICENAMERNNIEKGAVVVLDAKTSAILAMASAPSFDRFSLSPALTSEDSPFLNRALSSYSVGSVFKPVVAAAALENGESENSVFDCCGYTMVSGVRFNCHELSGHGENDMKNAMAVSCNSYFIKLGQTAGAESIVNIASALGFGKETVLSNGIVASSGYLPSADEIDSLPALANLSFGQGNLLATPLQIGALFCTFANGGYYREPYVVSALVDSQGKETQRFESRTNNKVLTDSVCERINEMLCQTVLTGSGVLAKPMASDSAGKTATAETGQRENGKEVVHTWFAGYYPAEDPEYVIVVFRENGISGAKDCAPVFRDIADMIITD